MARGIVIPKIKAKLGPVSESCTYPPFTFNEAEVTSIPPTVFPDDRRSVILLYSFVA